jgi:hypothetical protein
MFAAVSALYKENGARVFDRSSLLGLLVQLPVFGLLYKSNGMDAPTRNGISVPKWMYRATT